MKKLFIGAFVFLFLAGSIACHKNSGVNASVFLGYWRYTGSVIDSLGSNRSTTFFDSSAGPDLGDTLHFTTPDTVYYTYQGSTTWSNYRVSGNQLILVGSGASNTLDIYNLSGSQFQIGTQDNLTRYRYNFQKIGP